MPPLPTPYPPPHLPLSGPTTPEANANGSRTRALRTTDEGSPHMEIEPTAVSSQTAKEPPAPSTYLSVVQTKCVCCFPRVCPITWGPRAAEWYQKQCILVVRKDWGSEPR